MSATVEPALRRRAHGAKSKGCSGRAPARAALVSVPVIAVLAAAALAAAALGTGCGPKEPLPHNPGVSDVAPQAMRHTVDASAASVWPRATEVGGYAVVRSGFSSEGHFAGQWQADLLANAAALGGLEGPGAAAPGGLEGPGAAAPGGLEGPDAAAPGGLEGPGDRACFREGSVLVERMRDARALTPGPWYAMEKRAPGFFPAGGDWAYVVADARGTVEEAGALELCARCHAETSATGWVFEAPRCTPRRSH